MSSKRFACPFDPDVFCVFRITENFFMMKRCFECRTFLEFAREQEELEAEAFAELDRLVEREKLDG